MGSHVTAFFGRGHVCYRVEQSAGEVPHEITTKSAIAALTATASLSHGTTGSATSTVTSSETLSGGRVLLFYE